MILRRLAIACAALAILGAAAPAAQGAGLTAGAGRADITPPTGYYMMGWVRGDAKTTGQHTRLFFRTIVLERDGRKVALVAADLNAPPGGMIVDAAELLRDRGFSQENILVSASHTHAAPTGFYNFGTYNTVFMTPEMPSSFNTAADPQLYGFMVRQLAASIRRADEDRAPAAAAWGATRLLTLTRNRSLEAHLANHGIEHEYGEGSPAEDPLGPLHTIDPEVRVLRVDKVGKQGRRTPIGMWSTFADHGTVNKYTFHYYNADHHGSATRVVESKIRRAGRVPRGQEIVNAYGNTDEGDQSAGLDRSGPADSDYVGRVEAGDMLRAWTAAGKRLTREPALDLRWTRVCFCGQETEGGAVDDEAVIGRPLLTGSEEGRGPLFDVTHEHFEGSRLPVSVGPQGRKQAVLTSNDVPKAVPLIALRIADTMIASVPGEMTAGMGERVRAAVLGASRAGGIDSTVISGIANEYLQYFTTPEEYEMQHYEGGSTLYGKTSSNVLKLTLTDLAKSLVEGRAAPAAYDYDPRASLRPDNTPFDAGAGRGTAGEQPKRTARLDEATFAWSGGARGFDRPLEKPFVTVRRRVGGKWKAVDSDLGLAILWEVDENGGYRAKWEVPLTAPRGKYQFQITANRYTLTSGSFRVVPNTSLELRRVGSRVLLLYPPDVAERDLTYRPRRAHSGFVTYRVGAQTLTRRGRAAFDLPAGATEVPRSGARDKYGNRNGSALTLAP